MTITLTPKEIYKLFFHRKDVFASQQSNGAYFPTKRPVTINDIQEHLDGKKTIGAYCLGLDSTVKWACVDIDGIPEMLPYLKKEAIKIYELFQDLPRILEFSGKKGFHIWVFFKRKVTADYAQRLVKARLNRENLNHHEVFPKQTELNEYRKYGNLVKIPLALHRVSGKKSQILRMEGFK